MKRKLAVVTETWPPEINGVALTCEQMVLGMLSLGHQVDLYLPKPEKNYPERPNLTLHPLAGFRLPFYKEVRFGLPATRFLIRQWRLNQPDCVQIVTEGPLGFSAMRVAKALSIPVVSEFHTNFHQYSQYYKLGYLLRPLTYYLRNFHNRADITLVPTDEIRASLAQAGFTNLAVIGRGIDTQRFSPHKRDEELRRLWGLEPEQLGVIYVGRLAREKNLGLVVSSFRALQQKIPDARMIVVGDGPVRKSLETENPDFVFCGMQTGDQLARHYASGDLFLYPSTSETFGNVILEAMASGLPVLCYNYAAAKQYIHNGINGVTVPLNDENQFIRALIALSANRLNLRLLGQAASATTRSLDWSAIVKAYDQTVKRLLDNETTMQGVATSQTISNHSISSQSLSQQSSTNHKTTTTGTHGCPGRTEDNTPNQYKSP